MSSQITKLARSVIAVLLLLMFAWSLYLSVFNWWASDGPPIQQHPEVYRVRGNIFFGVSCGLLLAFILTLRGAIWGTKKRP